MPGPWNVVPPPPWVTQMPANPLPEITLRAEAADEVRGPPTTAVEEATTTPAPPLPRSTWPVTSVPMRLDSMWMPLGDVPGRGPGGKVPAAMAWAAEPVVTRPPRE